MITCNTLLDSTNVKLAFLFYVTACKHADGDFMKKYLSGGWAVLKNYIFAMIFFYIFFVGFYSKASLFSIAIFIVMIFLIYHELAHYAGVDKRRYGKISLLDGVWYGLIAIAPIVLIQVVISFLNFEFEVVNFQILKWNLIKGFAAPMLFIAKAGGYKLAGYAAAWSTMVLVSFLGYYAGSKGFDLNAYVRKLFGLQPKQKTAHNKRKNRR